MGAKFPWMYHENVVPTVHQTSKSNPITKIAHEYKKIIMNYN